MLYAIRCGDTGYVKFGYTSDGERGANARLRDMQTGCPYELALDATVEGDRAAEAWIHRHLADRHVRGEWFDIGSMEPQDILDASNPWSLSLAMRSFTQAGPLRRFEQVFLSDAGFGFWRHGYAMRDDSFHRSLASNLWANATDESIGLLLAYAVAKELPGPGPKTLAGDIIRLHGRPMHQLARGPIQFVSGEIDSAVEVMAEARSYYDRLLSSHCLAAPDYDRMHEAVKGLTA